MKLSLQLLLHTTAPAAVFSGMLLDTLPSYDRWRTPIPLTPQNALFLDEGILRPWGKNISFWHHWHCACPVVGLKCDLHFRLSIITVSSNCGRNWSPIFWRQIIYYTFPSMPSVLLKQPVYFYCFWVRNRFMLHTVHHVSPKVRRLLPIKSQILYVLQSPHTAAPAWWEKWSAAPWALSSYITAAGSTCEWSIHLKYSPGDGLPGKCLPCGSWGTNSH